MTPTRLCHFQLINRPVKKTVKMKGHKSNFVVAGIDLLWSLIILFFFFWIIKKWEAGVTIVTQPSRRNHRGTPH